jgi:hypothetical protein
MAAAKPSLHGGKELVQELKWRPQKLSTSARLGESGKYCPGQAHFVRPNADDPVLGEIVAL